MTKEEFANRNTQLRHAIQTGIEYERQWNPKFLDPKHIRVGLDSNQCEVGAIVKLLIDKGLITEEEYFDYSIKFLEMEVARYEQVLQERFGPNGPKITLG